MDNLVAAFRRIDIFECRAVFCRNGLHLDAIQDIERHFPAPGRNHPHAQAQCPRRKCRICRRPAQARSDRGQVTGKVTDNQIVHRAVGDERWHG